MREMGGVVGMVGVSELPPLYRVPGSGYTRVLAELCLLVGVAGDWGVRRMRGSCGGSSTRGSSQRNSDPSPSPSECAESRPLCSSTTPLDIHSPSPLPPPCCSWLTLNCTPSLNRFFWSSADMPAPPSLTVSTNEPALGMPVQGGGALRDEVPGIRDGATEMVPEEEPVGTAGASLSPSGFHCTVTVTSPPGEENLSALETRLRTTCDSLIESPTTMRESSSHLRSRLMPPCSNSLSTTRRTDACLALRMKVDVP
mmetsp:Transcript_15142/g.34050  ORF Transcript_15142/g.34050 Transcript_15142/m.34050 type:complete len:255 (+) Transcript_15142:153-917(+)